MNLLKVLKITVISAAVLGAAVSVPWAFCDSSLETYAIFQCSNRAYTAPVPAPWTPADVSGVFWQLGFGNESSNTGDGTDGTGVRSKSNFNGNDSGTFSVNILDAAVSFPGEGFPAGSICLGSNNWANTGIDGCCDNPRPGVQFSYNNQYHAYGPYYYAGDDNILNPYFGTYFNSIGYYGYLSKGSLMDYPTAMLMKTPDDSWFALAAVTNMDRGNNNDVTGPCNAFYPGTNLAACDIRQGFFNFVDVTNGAANAITGLNNVVPWQPAPRPRVTCASDCGDTALRVLNWEIGPVVFAHDGRSVPSNNPTLDNSAQFAAGVGVVDLLRKWNGLVRYSVEVAPLSAANLVDPNDLGSAVDYSTLVFAPDPNLQGLTHPTDGNGDPAGPVAFSYNPPQDSCFRVVVELGRVPVEAITNSLNCRDGGCGDVGYTIAGQNPEAITCIGGALVSENIASSALNRARGVFTLNWTTSAELSVQGFDIFAVNNRGQASKVADATCDQCTTGLPGTYSVSVSRGDLRGGNVESFRITMRGGNGDSVDLPVNGGGRALGRR